MPKSMSKLQRFFEAVKLAKNNPKAPAHLQKIASSMPLSNLDELADSTADLRLKKAMLGILKDIREPMYLEEDEKDANIDPVADSQEMEDADWSSYVKEYIGQPLTPKELEAVDTFKSETGRAPVNPIKGVARVIELWYRGTNKMNQSNTTVIRKLKDGTQYSYNAFTKYDKTPQEKDKDKAELETPPMEAPPMSEPDMGTPEGPGQPSAPGISTPPPDDKEKKEKEKDYRVVLTKSILFPINDDIQGGKILAAFLKKLDI